MNYIKNYSKAVLVSISMMIFLSLILTLFNYINIFSVKVCYVLLKIVIFISIFIGSYLMGKNTKNKGWLECIKFSLPFLLLFIIINKFSIYKCIYYIGFIICSIMGSILGINTKKGD